MRRIKLPRRYDLLITRPGRPAVRLSLSWLVPLLALALLVGWGLSTLVLVRIAAEAVTLRGEVNRLAGEVRRLNTELLAKEQENQRLAAKAASILEQLDGLEADLEALKKRAGLKSEEKKAPAPEPVGAGRPARTEELFKAAEVRLNALKGELAGRVEPALARTLAREAATPRGLPLYVRTYIASGFGVRKNPFGRGYEFHDGVDLPAWYGTPIHATAPGVVVEAGWSRIFGRYVKIRHGYGYATLYGHMSRIKVRRGQRVERGQVIGYVGSTGRSSGPHVHYTVFVGGRAVSPVPYLKTPGYASR